MGTESRLSIQVTKLTAYALVTAIRWLDTGTRLTTRRL